MYICVNLYYYFKKKHNATRHTAKKNTTDVQGCT